MKHHFTYICLSLVLLLAACSGEYDKELELRNGSSGVIKTASAQQGVAMRGERMTVYAKIGQTGAETKIFVGNAEAEILAHGRETIQIPLSLWTDDKGTAIADTFSIIVPEGAEIGVTNIYITVNGERSAPLNFTVKKPDILFPGEVIVSPLLPTPYQEPTGSGIDGPVGAATIGTVMDMGMDKQGAIYFIDLGLYNFNPASNYWEVQTNCIRKMWNGQITTIGGNGTDEYATRLSDLKLKTINAMKIADDGTIYLSVSTSPTVKMQRPGSSAVLSRAVPYTRILKINPTTGEVTTLVGRNNKFCWNLNGFNVIADGPADKAMIGMVNHMELDKEGNLYFMDDGRFAYSGSVLRKISKDGTVTTLAGAFDNENDYTFYDLDGTNPEVIHAASTPTSFTGDGFGKAAKISGAAGLVLAGNGNFYIAQLSGSVMKECVREFNPATNEVTTVIGKPVNSIMNFVFSGTFKEVDMRPITSFDADFDGNILIGYRENINAMEPRAIYKIDVNKEMVYKIAGFEGQTDANVPQPGNIARVGEVSRILFDQFGKLYVGFTYFQFFEHIHFSTITIDRQ